jgi:NADH-quinone oxidoreductase subunit J
MSLESLFLLVFEFLAVLSAVLVVNVKNPVHSILYVISVFCNTSAILLIIGAEFMSMILLVVYVGAIAVLFLFVVMMLNIRMVDVNEKFLLYFPVTVSVILLFGIEVSLLMHNSESSYNLTSYHLDWLESVYAISNLHVIGSILYTYYFHLFLTAGFVLLIAMIGCISLTLHHREGVKTQDVSIQLDRSNSILLYVDKPSL